MKSFSFYSHAGKSACTVVTLGNWDWFAEWEDERVMKRGEKYEAVKDEMAKKMWEQVLAYFPQLKDRVSDVNVYGRLQIKVPHGSVDCIKGGGAPKRKQYFVVYLLLLTCILRFHPSSPMCRLLCVRVL